MLQHRLNVIQRSSSEVMNQHFFFSELRGDKNTPKLNVIDLCEGESSALTKKIIMFF